MKRKWLFTAAALLCVCLSFGFASSCSPKKDPPPTVELEGSLTLNKSKVELDVGDSFSLVATLLGVEETPVYVSENPSVASVDANGLILAHSVGETTITVTAGGHKSVCRVTVFDSGVFANISLSADFVQISKDGTYTVEITTLRRGQVLDAAANGLVYTCEEIGEAAEEVASAVIEGEKIKIVGENYGTTSFLISTVYRGETIAEELTVNVCNLDTVIQVSDLAIENGNYVVNVSTENISGYENTFIPNVKVYEDGELNEAAEPIWSIDDESVASVDEATGEIISMNRGTTYARGVYEGVEVCIRVNVFRPECALENTPIDVEVLTGKFEYRLPELRGNVESVLLEDQEVLASYDGNGRKLVLDKNRLNFSKKEMGDKRLEIVTDRVVYTTTALVYSKVLRTAQDLNEMGFWAKLADTAVEYWDGYFALGNDISYTGEYSSFITWKILNDVGHGNKYYEGEYCGFRGTLDGRGYNIDGLTMSEGSSGLVGVLTTGGVVKNISFTNVRLKPYSSLVCATGCGKIENVYVQCNGQEGGTVAGNKQNGFFFSVFSMSMAVVKNCFIETAIDLKIDNANATFGVGSFIAESNGYASLQGVYVVGTDFGAANGWGKWAKIDNIAGRYGAYATKKELLAEVDFTSWEGDFWMVIKGKPVPKNLAPEPDRDNTAEWDDNW